MIFNIQKCSIHDGQGLRTLVFFKGCPLRCRWCSNPESQSYEKEIMESPVRCIGCGACRDVCPQSAISEDFLIDREHCVKCMKCTQVCYTIEELYKEIEKDKPFYSRFGGGVTFSGGEPLTHSGYLKEIAQLCRKRGIHVVVESCGFGQFDTFKEALPYIDAMFMDVKQIDPVLHEKLTGKSNELILENIRRISAAGIPITIRTPIIPGCTDTLENVEGIAAFVAELPSAKEYELLTYHNFGEPKYRALGRPYPLKDTAPPEDERMRELVKAANNILVKYGKECFYTKNNNKEVVK